MENDPLQQLKDVHLPADPSWWPPAFGWWLLTVLAVAAVVYGLIRAWRYHRARRPIRAARQEILSLYATPLDGVAYATEANAVLKRLLVHALGRRHYAPLVGSEWLCALDTESNSTNFTNGAGQALGDGRFAREADVDREALHDAVSTLIRNIKVAA